MSVNKLLFLPLVIVLHVMLFAATMANAALPIGGLQRTTTVILTLPKTHGLGSGQTLVPLTSADTYTYHLYLPAVVVPPAPGPITLNTITNGGQSSYSVNWVADTYAATYSLEEAANNTFGYPTVVYNGPALAWTVPSPKAAGTYYYRVRGRNSLGVYGPYGNVRSVTVNPPPPGTPTLSSINNSSGTSSYSVSWNSVANASGYVLQEASNGSFSGAVQVYTGAETMWNASGKGAGTYYYRVQATGLGGTSGWSNTQTTTVNPTKVCCKICYTGKACGDTCISSSYTCHQPPGCACNPGLSTQTLSSLNYCPVSDASQSGNSASQ